MKRLGRAHPPSVEAGVLSLWLDDTRSAPKRWDRVYNAQQAIEALDTKVYKIASLDHDLDCYHNHNGQTGLTVVKWMVDHDVWPTQTIYVHSWNAWGAEAMVDLINEFGPYDKLVRPTPAPSWPD